MRNAFVAGLVEVAEHDDRVVLLTGDLGFTVLERFAERFPERFFNVGVAEQNMIGIATGLAEAGFVPYVYSIATFASMRGYEFVRNGPVLHDLPVRVVGVGGGLDYGHNGVTHYAVEDVAIMRVQPNMTVVAPADAPQMQAAMPIIHATPGPAYLRLGKETSTVPGLEGRFALGRLELIGQGGDVALIALGTMAAGAVEAAQMLRAEGTSAVAGVLSSFNPSPVEDLADLLADVAVAVTVEAHYVDGGLGSLVAEVIAEYGLSCRLVRVGLRRTPSGMTGRTEYLYDRYGLSPIHLTRVALETLARSAR